MQSLDVNVAVSSGHLRTVFFTVQGQLGREEMVALPYLHPLLHARRSLPAPCMLFPLSVHPSSFLPSIPPSLAMSSPMVVGVGGGKGKGAVSSGLIWVGVGGRSVSRHAILRAVSQCLRD